MDKWYSLLNMSFEYEEAMNREYTITCTNNQSVLDVLKAQGVAVSAKCNARHTCGSCKIRYLYGDCEPTREELNVLSKEEIEDGIRLACASRPKDMVRIEILDKEEADILTNTKLSVEAVNGNSQVFAAFDLGTTTLAAKLIQNGQVIYTTSKKNSQCTYGADVVSRCEASINGCGDMLSECLLQDIEDMINEFPVMPTHLVMAGNTTIIHLLKNYPVEGLIKYPFTPYYSGWHKMDYVTDTGKSIPCTLLPDFSAYIGGDIMSGLYYCDYAAKDTVNLFVDLGTNGEMAIGNSSRILTCSAAAGPAFEGTKLNVATDVVKCMYELLCQGIIDANGLLKDPYFDEGYPYPIKDSPDKYVIITQQDIRNIQMAKAAIRAGIDLLITGYGADAKSISKLYLAGGMGTELDLDAAVGIGLIPSTLINKVEAVGNSSLGGCIKYGLNNYEASPIDKLRAISSEILLSNEPDFQNKYYEYMLFDLINS